MSSVEGQYEDPVKAIIRFLYPFRIFKINRNIFNKHKRVRVLVSVLRIDCDYGGILNE